MKYDLHVHDDIEYYLLYWVDESGSIVVMISFTQFFQGCRHIIISDSEKCRGNSWIFFHFFFFYWHIIFLYCTFNVLRQLLKLIKISIKILSFNMNHMTETKLKIWTIDFRWSPSLRKFFQFFFFLLSIKQMWLYVSSFLDVSKKLNPDGFTGEKTRPFSLETLSLRILNLMMRSNSPTWKIH